jgi:cytochrome c
MKYLIAFFIMFGQYQTAIASADLARSKNCMACHAVDRKLVGPSFKDISGRYSQKDIPQLATSIQRGGAGKWGPIPMPAQPNVSADEATALARWILEQK